MTMPAVHMTPRQWDQIAAILLAHAPHHQFFAFGSRATGKRVKQYSDLDLAVAGELESELYMRLVDAFDESLLPFKVDLVELDRVSPSFRARIQPDLVPLTLTFA